MKPQTLDTPVVQRYLKRMKSNPDKYKPLAALVANQRYERIILLQEVHDGSPAKYCVQYCGGGRYFLDAEHCNGYTLWRFGFVFDALSWAEPAIDSAVTHYKREKIRL